MPEKIQGGQYLGINRKQPGQYYVETSDTHTLTIGATRCGKTRCIVLPSICIQALAGESMILSDPKGELYLYACKFLEMLGYEVIAIDFKNPRKSCRYNFLQPVIDAVNAEDIPLAIMRTRDVVESLAHSDGMERIWTDGEKAMLTCGILAVVYDNQEKPQYQNLTNVYYFLGKMCTAPTENDPVPLVYYLASKPDIHPAKASLHISNIAPEKMRGSFYTSAVTALELFVDPNVYDMTCDTDFDIYATGIRKRAIFIILPDHKTTYYSSAALFVQQQYQLLVDCSDQHGNRLPRRVNFDLDEFGNFTKIPDFPVAITVGGGRGIRFNLYLQAFSQLEERYGKESAATIRANAETWIYLQCKDQDTLKELSDKLGTYTVKSPSISSSSNGSNFSASSSLVSRPLLFPYEIEQISRPYSLVFSRNAPSIMYAPDISQTIFNDLLGMGTPEHNQRLLEKRQRMRPEREVQLPQIWNPISNNKSRERKRFQL